MDAQWHFTIDYNSYVSIKFYTLPWPRTYFDTILYNIKTLSTTTIADHSYSMKKVQNLTIQLFNQASKSTALVKQNDGQRYYSNVESLILIKHFLTKKHDQSSQMIDDLCHIIDLIKIKFIKI